jgi:hypothetical protein
MSWAGDIQSYDPMIDGQPVFHVLPGDRSFGATTRGPHQVSATVRWLDQVGSEWHDFLAVYGYGSASGLTDYLGDFTMQVNKYDGTNNNWHFLNGCKINRADISGSEPGKELMFEAEVFAQWLQIETHASSKAIAGQMQDVTPGADGATPGGATLYWAANQQINIAAGGLATWYPRNWKLSVANYLNREFGIKTGDDAVAYSVAIAMHEGMRDIIFTGEVLSQNETYTLSKQKEEAITALTIPVDDETITLSNGEWDEPSLGAIAQTNNTNYEPIQIRFKSLSIA